ncbi:hypothetical protein ACROYT_G002147 [Oculina patagonica]
MKNRTVKTIFRLALLLLSWLSYVAGRPIPRPRCSQISEIERYDPSDPGAVIECKTCPDCPEGLGLSPQCGTRVTMDIKIECRPCIANKTYSDSHGIESCKACPECGLRNVNQSCTPSQKRECGTECPQRHFLDHNNICQECYFCCDSVSEAARRKECKEIGMDKNWQCEKTNQNQRCKEALDKVTTKPANAKLTAPHGDNHTMTEKHLVNQVNETISQISKVSESTPTKSPGTGQRANDDSASEVQLKQQEKGQEDHGFLKVVLGVVAIIVIILAVALFTSKRAKTFFKFSRIKQAKLADSTELQPLQSSPTDSGRTSPEDIKLTNEVSSKDADRPNPADIPADCRVSEMEQLRDNKGKLMLFHVRTKLDVPSCPTRNNWRSVGQALGVSTDDLDLIETDYIARRSPTESLLSILKSRAEEPTMREFVEALISCDRHDVANFICNWPWKKLFLPVDRDNPPEMVSQAAKDSAIEVG